MTSAGTRLVARIRQAMDPAKAGYVGGAMRIVAGAGAAQVLVIASSPILTRLYSPHDYGVYGVATSILIVTVVTCLRFEYAIPLPEDERVAANLLALSMLANLVMSLLTLIVLLVVGGTLLDALGASTLGSFLLLLALAQFAGGAISAFVNWAIRQRAYGEIGANRLTQSGVLVGVQLSLGAFHLGLPALILGAVVGNVAAAARLAWVTWRTHAVALRDVTWAGMRAAAVRYRRFPLYSSGSALLAHLGVRAPLLLIVAVFGTTVGGHYALAERVLYLPLTLIADSVGQVFTAEAARLARESGGALRRLFIRTTASLALAAAVPAVLIALTAPAVAGPIFGEEWAEVGPMVAVLVPMFYLQFVMTSTGDVLYLVERQPLHLVREVVRATLIGGSLPVGSALGLTPIQAIGLLSAAGCVTYVLYGLISWFAIRRYQVPRAQPGMPSAA